MRIWSVQDGPLRSQFGLCPGQKIAVARGVGRSGLSHTSFTLNSDRNVLATQLAGGINFAGRLVYSANGDHPGVQNIQLSVHHFSFFSGRRFRLKLSV